MLAALGLLALAASASAANGLLVDPHGWHVEGRFAPTTPEGCAHFDRAPVNIPEFSTCALPNAGEGVFRTEPFRAPDVLRFWMGGFTRQPGIRVYLEDLDRKRTLDLRATLEPSLRWRERIWEIPPEWRAARVRLVAEDHSHNPVKGWLSLSLPQSGGDSYFFQLARALYRAAFLVPLGLLALLPGAALTLYFAKRRALEAWRAIAWILTGSGLGAYASFWPYLIGPALGRVVSVLLPLASVAAIAWMLRGGWSFLSRGVLREASLCFAVLTLVAILSASCGFLFYTDDAPGEFAQTRYFEESLPPDNVLPEIVAAHLYYGESVAKIAAALTTHSSDRPPLESSFFLMEYPFWILLTKALSGYLLAIWLQCCWVAGMWVLLRAANVPYRWLIPAIVLSTLAGFCLVHSFYVWPKLLSAAFCLISLACFPGVRNGWSREPGSALSFLDAVLAAAAASLSLLCHPNCAFTFLALGAVALFMRALPRPSMIVAGVAIAFFLLFPWKLYQLFYDPTGEMLAKLHLAGSPDPNATLAGALAKGYGALTPGAWLAAKAKDLAVIGGDPSAILEAPDLRQFLIRVLGNSFYSLCFTVGVLWLGAVARFFAPPSPARRFADRLLLLAGVSVVFWILIMFQAGSTYVHQGSFATVLLLFAVLGMYLALAGPRWVLSAVVLQSVQFAAVVFSRPLIFAKPGAILDGAFDGGMFTVILLSLAAICWFLIHLDGEPAWTADASPAFAHKSH